MAVLGCGYQQEVKQVLIKRCTIDCGWIEGRITDKETGEPVIGASISIVGTTMGAQTDSDGKYRVRCVPADTN